MTDSCRTSVAAESCCGEAGTSVAAFKEFGRTFASIAYQKFATILGSNFVDSLLTFRTNSNFAQVLLPLFDAKCFGLAVIVASEFY